MTSTDLPDSPGHVSLQQPVSNSSSGFAAPFGRLVELLRYEPEQIPGQKDALRSALRALRRGAVRLEAGVESSEVTDERSLKARLLARRVDTVDLLPGAAAADLLALARSLAADGGDFPASDDIRLTLVPTPIRNARPDTGAVRPSEGTQPPSYLLLLRDPAEPRPARLPQGLDRDLTTLVTALQQAAAAGDWGAVLQAGQALVRMAPRIPDADRRSFGITVRREFPPPVVDGCIEHALRVTEEQYRAAEVLQWLGAPAAERMVEYVRQSESVGIRRFLHDALARIPEAFPLLAHLTTSAFWHEARHGAELLGRLGLAEGVGPLRVCVTHPEERVVLAAVEALGRLGAPEGVDPLRRALRSASPEVRIAAAAALAAYNSGSLVMPLAAALDEESDPRVWRALVQGLAQVDSDESGRVLLGLVLQRPVLLRGRRSLADRLAIVEALAGSETRAARRMLDTLVRRSDGVVKAAAIEALRRKG